MSKVQMEKTVYDKPSPDDGKRILVMRLWPRGVRKNLIGIWLKDVGTDRELIKDWKAGKVTQQEFERRYKSMMRGEEQRRLSKRSPNTRVKVLSPFSVHARRPNQCHRSILKKLVEAEL